MALQMNLRNVVVAIRLPSSRGGNGESSGGHMSCLATNNATGSGGHGADTVAKRRRGGCSGTYTGVIATEHEVGCDSRKETPLW